jgi:hypothetical protein
MNTLVTNPEAEVLPLSSTDLTALAECEQAIRNGNEAIVGIFVHQGRALQRILSSRLYRGKYRTFEEYCPAEFEFSDRHARGLMRAADIFETLQKQNVLILPKTESQARPLSKLSREEWAPAWQEAVDTAPEGKIRANHVAAVVQRRLNRLKPANARPTCEEGSWDMAVTARTGAGLKVPEAPADSPAKPIIDVPDLSTREERVIEAALEAGAKLRYLQDLMRTADSATAAKVTLAIQYMEELRDHTWRTMNLQASRKLEQKETEATKL